MRKVVLTFGVISGLVSAGMFMLFMPFIDQIGFDRGMVIGYASMLAASMLIYFGIRSYRDNVGGGRIGFGRALAVGLQIVAISGAIYSATWVLVGQRFMPDFYEKYKTHQLESARADGATQAELDAKAAEMDKYIGWARNPILSFFMTFMEPLPVGLAVAILSSWALSRRPRDEAVPALA
jgi:hypothetical protein